MNDGSLYRKTVCPHCLASMMIEYDPTKNTINLFIPVDPDIFRAPATQTIATPQTKRTYKKREVKKIASANVSHSKPRFCTICGKSGHRRDTCPENGGAKKRRNPDAMDGTVSEKKEDRPLTEGQYDFVQDNKKDLTSLQMANEMNMPLEEVNKAFVARDYDYYIEHR